MVIFHTPQALGWIAGWKIGLSLNHIPVPSSRLKQSYRNLGVRVRIGLFPGNVNLNAFDNTDPRILTLLVIGTEDNVKAHILRLHTLGVVEAGVWSKPIPVPNCPGKVMRVFTRMMG